MNTLKLALEALQSCKDKRDVLDWHQVFDTKLVNGAIEKLQAEIARDGEAVGQAGGTGVVSWFNDMPKRGTYLFTHPAPNTVSFQSRVKDWLLACFGEEIAKDIVERNHRFLEESLELVQSLGCTESEAHQLVEYVYNRNIGEVNQEAGGVMVTLAALCEAAGIHMQLAGETELARIWTKVEQIREKQAAKPKHSPMPMHVQPKTKPLSDDDIIDFWCKAPRRTVICRDDALLFAREIEKHHGIGGEV